MMKKVALYGSLLALFGATAAFGAGQFPGYPISTANPATGSAATSPLTGLEVIPADTNLLSNYVTTTGSISGTTLTVSSGTGLAVGENVTGANVQPGTQIVSGSGTSWVVTPSQTVASTSMNFGGAGVNPQTEVIQTQQLKAYVLSAPTVTSYMILPTSTIAALPTCGASTLGAIALVSNGTAYATGTYGSAVSATGAVTRVVACTNTGGATTYAWAYN
jgi:hypothetical protein